MVTAMALFTVFVVIFTGAVAGLVGSINGSRAAAEGSSTNGTIAGWMDRQVRYAESINYPGVSGGHRYIEFYLPRSVSSSGNPQCIQWRFEPSSGLVEARDWDLDGGGAAINITGWRTRGTLTFDLGGVDYPFQMLPADLSKGLLRQRLQLTLATGSVTSAASQMQTSFVARNSSTSSVTNLDVNGDGQSDTQVCMQAGGRP